MKNVKNEEHCEELCADVKKPSKLFKVFVGVVLPKKAATAGVGAFELCQGGKCVKSGEVTTFGSTSKTFDIPPGSRTNGKDYYLRKTDVTRVVIEQGWTLDKELEAKMRIIVVGNLPGPVVLVRKVGKDGTVEGGDVIQSPKEKHSND